MGFNRPVTDEPKRVGRYPGVGSFGHTNKDLFFGRDREIIQFFTLMQVEPQILLYSDSGNGKTSLINAGLWPKFEDKYIEIKVEFGYYSDLNSSDTQNSSNQDVIWPLDRVFSLLNDKLDINVSTELDLFVKDKAIEDKLWLKVQNLQLANSDKEILFVFDQFEELFSYPSEKINEFIDQFQKCLIKRIPNELDNLISERVNDDLDFTSSKEFSVLNQVPNVVAIYSIRKDRLGKMMRFVRKMPDLQNGYFELFPLSIGQAKKAIRKPAEKIDEDRFITPPFTFDDETLNKILEELKLEDDFVDLTQLQIICEDIEKHYEVFLSNKSSNCKDLKGFRFVNNSDSEIKHKLSSTKDAADFKNVYKKYYLNSIKKLPNSDQKRAHKIIGTRLIVNATRISLDENSCDRMDKKTLELLEETHLIKPMQNPIGNRSYVLSHDKLIEPILSYNKDVVRKKRVRWYYWFLAILIMLFCIILFLSFIRNDDLKVENNSLTVKNDSLIEKVGKKINQNQLYDSLIQSQENINTVTEFYALTDSSNKKGGALKSQKNITSEIANDIKSNNLANAKRKIDSLNKIVARYSVESLSKFNKLIEEAKELERNEKDWKKAIDKYVNAEKMDVPTKEYAKERRVFLKNKLDQQVDEYIKSAVYFSNFGPKFHAAALDRFVMPGLVLAPGNEKLKSLKDQLKRN